MNPRAAEAFIPWANPLLPTLTEPTLGPWASPGRVSLAPALTEQDQDTWDEAASYARTPWPRTFSEALLWHVIAQQRELWPLPDDPLDPPEWLRRQRLRPYSDYAGRIADPALCVQVRL